MTAAAVCDKGHALDFYVVSLSGVVWQRCPCGEKPVPRQPSKPSKRNSARVLMVCSWCRSEFHAPRLGRSGIRYCCPPCKTAAAADRRRIGNPRHPQETRACAHCATPFTVAVRSTRTCCSPTCSNTRNATSRTLRARMQPLSVGRTEG